jgi:uncharacterized protein
MAHESFARELRVACAPDEVWAVMTDVDRLVSWVSILEEAHTDEELARYRATLQDRLGMFALRADLAITVDDYEQHGWLRASAEGEDRQVGSRITVGLQLKLAEAPDGTDLRVSGEYEVTGRVATLGASTIRRKADKVLEEFFGNLANALS